MDKNKKAKIRPLVTRLSAHSITEAPLLLLACIDGRWHAYLEAYKQFRKDPSGDNVRVLRVATRRLRTLLQMLECARPYKPLRQLVREYKKHLNSLDELRDAQVTLGLIEPDLARFPALEPFHQNLQKKEARRMKAAEKEFKKLEPAETARALLRWLEKLETQDPGELQERLMEPIDEAFQAARERLGRVEAAEPGSIHRARLAFKKLRYRIEVVQPLLPEYPPEALGCLKPYQGRMGAVQDLRILLQGLEDFADSHAGTDLNPPVQFYEQRLAEAVSDYMKHKDQLNDFWRPEPGQPFPWRQTNENIPAETWNCDGAG